jgi:hypothetical protein
VTRQFRKVGPRRLHERLMGLIKRLITVAQKLRLSILYSSLIHRGAPACRHPSPKRARFPYGCRLASPVYGGPRKRFAQSKAVDLL